jgi:hypothetical protein
MASNESRFPTIRDLHDELGVPTTRDDWNRSGPPGEGGDCRKLVTLEKDGMIWVGVRAWNGVDWLNNGARDRLEKVLAWQELPHPAYSDGLISPMSGPTLPEGDA